MMRAIPSVAKCMTLTLYTVGADQSLSDAHVLMSDHGIRHLPVLRGSDLVGVLNNRDLALLERFPGVDPRTTRVEEAMSLDVYTVSPAAPLDQVVREMAAKQYASAVVVLNRDVVGILTTVDVCAALASLLRSSFSN